MPDLAVKMGTVQQIRLWAISVLLGWCLDLTPADSECAPLTQAWYNAGLALKEIK